MTTHRNNPLPEFHFGSRLPLAVDLVFYALAGAAMWIGVNRLAATLGDAAALVLCWGIAVAAAGLWGFQWRQRVIVTSSEIKVWRGLFSRDLAIRRTDIADLSAGANGRRCLKIYLRSGKQLKLLHIRKLKFMSRLEQLERLLKDTQEPAGS
jgi:hypothetical protein